MFGLSQQVTALQCRHQARGQRAGIGIGRQDPVVDHAPKPVRQQSFPTREVLRQRRSGLVVLISNFDDQIAQGTAIGTVLQSGALNEGVAPPPQTTHRLQSRQALPFTLQDLLTTQSDHCAHQFRLTTRKMLVQLRFTGSCRRPHIVESDGIDAADVHEFCGRRDHPCAGRLSAGGCPPRRLLLTAGHRQDTTGCRDDVGVAPRHPAGLCREHAPRLVTEAGGFMFVTVTTAPALATRPA